MEKKEHYRHELKYTINYWQYLQLRSRFRQVMKMDPHTRADGTYSIRSIYFDNIQDKALREKVNGVAKREKFRIRYYNDNFERITLEKKIKNNNLCIKVSAGLSEKECRKLLNGDLEWMKTHSSSLVQELYGTMKYQQLRPRVLVSYTRSPTFIRQEMYGSPLTGMYGPPCTTENFWKKKCMMWRRDSSVRER